MLYALGLLLIDNVILLWATATNVYINIYSLEDCKCEASLRDCVPRPLHQVFEFGRPQAAEEDFSHELAEQDDKDERLHVDDRHAGTEQRSNIGDGHFFENFIF